MSYPSQGTIPNGITAGPDGAVWYTVTDAIERIASNGSVTRFGLAAGSGPARITNGPDEALWFTQITSNRIGRITTLGVVQNFAIPTGNSYPNVIARGPDGALWFTESLGGKIGRITVAGTITNEYVVGVAGPQGDQPYGIVAGPDGALWFTEKFGNKIGRITTSGVITKFPIPTANSEPHSIVVGPDGALWFVERMGNKVGRITTSGVITEYPMPTPGTDAFGIDVGSDGALWYSGRTGNRIGRITTDGAITDYPVPTANAGPLFIARGPDGDLWFTENGANKIGRVGYERFFLPMLMKPDPARALPLRITPAIPARPAQSEGEVFFRSTLLVNYQSGQVLLAGNEAGTAASCVDDRIILVVTRPDSTQRTFVHTCLSPGRNPMPLPPTALSTYFLPGVNTVTVELHDVYGSQVSSTELWLTR